MASDPTAVTKLYEQLPLQAMQQVSESYMAWYVDRVTAELDKTMAGLRAELRDNDAKEASYRPSPNELGAIERLQRSAVTGVDLLDRMVEQGEDWLMLTMRRLDHFERTGLAPKDYSTWCEHSLGGAYDWIDHERLGVAATPGAAPARPGATPEWLAGRGGQQRPEDNPTAPVPSVAPRFGDSGYYGPGASRGGQQQQQQQQQGDESDNKGRNIFRIFTN
ncbi:MAG: hypothetical protein IVW57_12695 [Ktedonobacterales bacterium]|nr:hypothetical protein [Ktedonobacterales bacterium]